MGQVNLIRFGHKKVNKGGSILITGGIIAYKPIFPKNAHMGMICSALNGYVIGAAEIERSGRPNKCDSPSSVKRDCCCIRYPGGWHPPCKRSSGPVCKVSLPGNRHRSRVLFGWLW